MDTRVNLTDLNKWFGSFQVLDSINLSISIREIHEMVWTAFAAATQFIRIKAV